MFVYTTTTGSTPHLSPLGSSTQYPLHPHPLYSNSSPTCRPLHIGGHPVYRPLYIGLTQSTHHTSSTSLYTHRRCPNSLYTHRRSPNSLNIHRRSPNSSNINRSQLSTLTYHLPAMSLPFNPHQPASPQLSTITTSDIFRQCVTDALGQAGLLCALTGTPQWQVVRAEKQEQRAGKNASKSHSLEERLGREKSALRTLQQKRTAEMNKLLDLTYSVWEKSIEMGVMEDRIRQGEEELGIGRHAETAAASAIFQDQMVKMQQMMREEMKKEIERMRVEERKLSIEEL